MHLKTLLFSATLALAQLVHADTITDTSLNVKYTATSTFVPVSGNTYNVFLKVDPTGFSAGSGFLTALSLQFKTGNDLATSVSLLAAPGGISAWSTEDPGGLNSGGCNGKGASSGDVCFQNISANTPVAGGPYNFTFSVTLPVGDLLTSASDIKAAYNTLLNNSGKNLGLTSQAITIQQATPSVPEPGTWGLFGTGLLGLVFAAKRNRRQKLS